MAARLAGSSRPQVGASRRRIRARRRRRTKLRHPARLGRSPSGAARDLGSRPSASEVREHVRAALEAKADPLVVDVCQLTFLDSSGLQVLFEAHDWAQQQGRRFVVVNGSAAVDRVFKLTDADQTLTVVTTL